MDKCNFPEHMIRAVLFDKDDTLIDLQNFWEEPVRRTAAEITEECGCSDGTMRICLEKAAGFSKGKIIAESPVVSGTNRDVIFCMRKILRAHGIMTGEEEQGQWEDFLSHACTVYGKLTPKADYKRILPAWRMMGIRMGIVTSDVRSTTLYSLRKMDLLKYFDEIISADDVAEVKPAPNAAMLFCSRQGVRPSETVMIGDSDNDMLFAKKSGLYGILFRENSNTLPVGASMAVDRIEDVTAFLQKQISLSDITLNSLDCEDADIPCFLKCQATRIL